MMRIDQKEPRLVGESAHIRAIHREIGAAAHSDAKVQLFNMPAGHYKRFLGFLQKHQCQVPYRSFRDPSPATARAA